jgi:uncharacterized protein (DUF1330 family)
MSDKVIVIFTANVNTERIEALQAYIQKAQPMTAEAGGVTILNYTTVGSIAGENNPQMVVGVEFPNAAAVHALYDSEEYKALIPDRDKGLLNLNIFAVKPKV